MKSKYKEEIRDAHNSLKRLLMQKNRPDCIIDQGDFLFIFMLSNFTFTVISFSTFH